jgi:drug/metabolite transporter (DMT)-like permease
MRASALSLGLMGIAASFLPKDILSAVGAPSLPILTAGIQLLGAAQMGLAMLNWMAQANLLGGIYSRPVAVCNLTHYAIAFLALAKAVSFAEFNIPIAILTVYYVVFAALFGLVLQTHPAKLTKARRDA